MRLLAKFLPARADRSEAGESSRRSEAGDTLIEVLMAMVVIGITAVGLLAAFATSISTSEQHRSLATDDTILKSYVESATYQIAQAPAPNFLACASVATYTTGVDAVAFVIPSGDSGYAVGISSVSYWNGSTFAPTCVNSSTAPQQITAYATGPHHTYDSLNFIVVDPNFATPAQYATQLVVTTQPPPSAAAGLSFTVAVSLEDTLGNVVLSSSAPVTLAIGTNPSGGTLRCTSDPVSASSGVATFSCYVDLVGTGYTLTASSGGFSPVTTNPVAITVGSPNKFVFTTGAVSGPATSTATLGPITVQEEDTYGNATTTAETVNLASNSTGTKEFAATSGGTTITSIPIPAGSSSATFYYGDTKAGAPTLTASGSLTSATQVETVTAGTGTKLVITSSAFSASAGTSPTTAFTTKLEDTFGNPTTASTAITIGLGSSSTGNYEFATTSGGSTVTSVTLPANTQSVVAYYGDNKSGTPQIAAAGSGLSSGTQSETVNPAAPNKFAFTTGAVSGPATSTATLGPITVQDQDTYGNPTTTAETVNLASSSTGTKEFAATSGGTTITSISIPAGSSSATFYYGDTLAATPTLTASGSLLSATQVETVTAGSGSKLVITSASISATASTSPTSAFTTTLEDTFGNPTTASTAITIGLGSSSTGAYEFATTSGGPATVTTVTLPASSSSVVAYYGDNTSGSPQITVTNSAETMGTQNETVTAAAASKLVFILQPAGAAHTSAFTTQPEVAIEDMYSNIVTTNTSSVAMGFGTNPITGSTLTCAAVNASSGVANFAGCAISKTGNNYTLRATDGSLMAATSGPFNVS